MMDDIEAIMYRDLKKQYELARPIIRRVVISVEVELEIGVFSLRFG